MDVLLIEDEVHAALRVEQLLKELKPGASVVGKIDSVKRAVEYLKNSPPPDLALMDIQLADGTSFEIFERCAVKCPVIFITAYDAYAVKAFKVNSVDYILKPLDREEFRSALEKFESLHRSGDGTQLLGNISEAIRMLTRKYKTRFVIKVGEHLRTIETRDVLFFYSQDKTTFCATVENRNQIIDYTLEQLEDMLDPENFFRINRKYLVSAAAIKDIVHYTNSRLKLVLRNASDNDIIVARERVQDFKAWLDK